MRMYGLVGMVYGDGRVVTSTVQILASSLPFTLIRYGTSLRLLDQVPKFPNSDTALLVRVKVSSSLGLPVAGAFIMVSYESKACHLHWCWVLASEYSSRSSTSINRHDSDVSTNQA